MKSISCLLPVLTLYCSMLSAATASQADAYIAQARSMKLAEQPGWLALLHYRKESISRQWQSQADDDDFFLSEQGKTDAGLELEADIAAFLLPAAAQHAQCRFPARWHWLKQQLQLGALHDVNCPALASWLQRISGKRLSLVFPVMYLGNPGSSFGHTFLRFDDDEALLSYALNYAAAVDQNDGFLAYVYKGLFGGYKGVFGVRPYFETVQLYNDIENRDIWEYSLNFSAEQIMQLARHVWEVSATDFDYYFFNENCSYRLLALLDVVAPEAALASGDDFSVYTIPVDTVRALEKKNLVSAKHYRPSLASRLRADFSRQPAEDKARVLALADSRQPLMEVSGGLEQRADGALLLEQAYTLLQFRNQATAERADELLALRSRLPQRSADDKLADTVPVHAPESGHASARFALGGGSQNQQNYIELVYRPAFHDLLDSQQGYAAGSQIKVLDTRLKWFPAEEQLQLERLDFISIVSLNPVTEWYTPLSWQLELKLERNRVSAADTDMVFISRAGGGYSVALADTTLFAMLLLELGISDDYEHDYSLLAGAQLGASITMASTRALLQFESVEPVSGFERDRDSATAALQFNLSTNTALRAGYTRTRYDRFDDEDWFVRLQQYF